ncbi:MAG TPA: methyltransferase domain-containing protein [Candidatus Eisenbacteria bacterium]|nr:methyltransferase domain-containing protein [Candidatus Eisenbacteria bacterium]
MRLVFGALGAHYVRIRPYEDFGGVEAGTTCERLVLGAQPAGLLRVNLVAYHLALPDVEGKVVVDAGTNEGAGAALLATRAARVSAFDIAPGAIAAASARYARTNLDFRVHDATKPFPLPDGSADVVISSEVIEHLRDGAAFVRHAARVLRPDGILFVKTPNDDFNRLENRLNPHHVNCYTAKRLRAEVQAEFEEVRLEGLTYDVAMERTLEERPDPRPPEEMGYSFGDPIVIDRALAIRMRITPRRVPLGGPEPPEYLWLRAARPRAAGRQEGSPPRR